MGIHISCDSCYKSKEIGEDYFEIVTSSSNKFFPIKHTMIICKKCSKDTEYFYFNMKNPNYIKPAEPEIVDEVKSAG
jgi:hypothetical protein